MNQNFPLLAAKQSLANQQNPAQQPQTGQQQPSITQVAQSEEDLLDKGKKKKKTGSYDFNNEMNKYGNRPMTFDNNTPANVIVADVAKTMNIRPDFLFSSAYVEGMNKAIVDPDGISEAYAKNLSQEAQQQYPVDGFYSYGLDTFGTKLNELKQFLPPGFESRYVLYDALNENNKPIKTVAFKTNKDALIAKAAFLKHEENNVKKYAQAKGLNLDSDALDYFTMASYNGGPGNMHKMLDEYASAKDKKAFIDQGLTSKKFIHQNVKKRMDVRGTARKLLNMPEPQQQIQGAPTSMSAPQSSPIIQAAGQMQS